MTWKLRFGITLAMLLAVSITPSFSLKCYYCRTNLCNHKFCNETNSLMETSETTMSADGWRKVPICPAAEDERKASDGNGTDYVTCPKKAVACGRTIFNITATSTKNILPGSAGNPSSIVPILGSGRETANSSVIVYGCVLPKFKSCPHDGYSLEFKVPEDSKQQNSSDVSAVTSVIATNTESACCHCKNDLCNEIHGNLDCSPQLPESVSDTGVGGTAGVEILRPCSTALLFIGVVVLASF